MGLCKQVEVTQATNELISKLFSIMSTTQVKDIAIPPPTSVSPPPPVPTILKVLQASQIKLGAPNSFNGDRAQGRSFLTSCKLYIPLTVLDFSDDQVCIHLALSYFKSGCVVTFAKSVVRQEMKSGQINLCRLE
jgi:hypothetical protein